ncbi:MAG: [FeFe] hydrogenase H-cluster maturation GTPase HydF [Phascolarctobacterium sp.]|nr:[FeFe] hydrogenase H-cluster maturation GTPase HydF [Phascolarctobacterium sp.]
MSLNCTPSGERIHIGIFGKRNAGKSSLINAITSQDLSIVSDQKGTTTDPVFKAMELLPLGPVMVIDTPGIDDEGELGNMRVQRAYQILNKTHLAILVVDGIYGLSEEDEKLLAFIQEKNVPVIVAFNKSELLTDEERQNIKVDVPYMLVSAATGENIYQFKTALAKLLPEDEPNVMLEDLLQPNDVVVLVTPIDSSAPKGRLILPQQLVIRNIIDNKGIAIVVQPDELENALAKLNQKPRLVVTDSQVFSRVAKIVPEDIELTSFSILMARYKGALVNSINGVKALDSIQDDDIVLISEGCTHHRQCDDIGTVKLPNWIRNHTKSEPKFVFTSGNEFPIDLHNYKMIIHCGGCMLNEREIMYRNKCAHLQNIPMTNYGIAIAYLNGILKRTLAPFPEVRDILK